MTRYMAVNACAELPQYEACDAGMIADAVRLSCTGRIWLRRCLFCR